ncbi:glycosyltransferase family 4 protein [Aquidulcibacter sp.]|uniref:glycosyltransferase family 4 protein n=1 Tax=Aquidulcibacter sp. TaxID=2052990 RepID=UPI0025BA27FD|nr:glycosyltransferase family 4 protein [Aquidulcibacter sp.]MCA3693198.1 glycosyltransferase family 4 protein [Aquidulcibacter sp.]
MQPAPPDAPRTTLLPSLEGLLRFLPQTAAITDRRVAIVGTFPPRRCGIATFTADVQRSLNLLDGWACELVRILDDDDALTKEPSLCLIRQHVQSDYRKAADRLNHLGIDVISIQHEFGIFGGIDGAYILDLIDRLTAPVVITMHTVIETPTQGQRHVVAALLRRADQVIVMAKKGADLLGEIYGADPAKITICPHGTPDRPFARPDSFKASLGLSPYKVLLTFGLLSPGKGLETLIAAMPEIVAAHPDALYVVLGATHPNLKRVDGEAYRDGLIGLAEDLGVAEHIRFVDAFVDEALLLTYLSAADIYVTPYLNQAQVTSGTLAYAIALGKPVISTPFWHATEWVDETCGALVDFGDSAGFARVITRLLRDPDQLLAAGQSAYTKGRTTIWERSAEAYAAAFQTAMARRQEAHVAAPRLDEQSLPSLLAVQRVTDACGIMQHASYGIDNRAHGYCIDDAVRALILIQRFRQLGHKDPTLDHLERTYAAFVQHAWNPSTHAFRNFMGYDRTWLEAKGSADSNGRTFWALGETACNAEQEQVRLWAIALAKEVAPSVATLGSLRAQCFTILGAVRLLQVEPHNLAVYDMLVGFAEGLMTRFETHSASTWQWLEPNLSYDNARLPQALIEAGVNLGRPDMLAIGLKSLAWLDTIQKAPNGFFRAVGSSTPGVAFAPPRLLDQQPIEACATIDAALAAYAATKQSKWLIMAQTAHAWFFGENDNGLPLSDQRGGCFDGLTETGVNRNQGAESILALQMANCAMALVTGVGLSPPTSPIGLSM